MRNSVRDSGANGSHPDGGLGNGARVRYKFWGAVQDPG